VSQSDSILRVFIVVSVRVYRDGLAEILRAKGLLVVGAHRGGGDVAAHVSAARPDVVILDVGDAQSMATARDLQQGLPGIALVAVGVSDSDTELVNYAEAGVTGYVATEASLSALIATVESAARGELICSAGMMREVLRRLAIATGRCAPALHGAPLTGRERQIADRLQEDQSNREIAAGLSIEISTVKHHVHNILRKIGVGRRSEAVLVLKRATKGVPTLVRRNGSGSVPEGTGSN
jgi:two-component system nitrate/nitrite response regulator NarL